MFNFDKKNLNRIPLILIIAIFILPMIFAWRAYQAGGASHKSNYGQLIVPTVPIGMMQLTPGIPQDLTEIKGKWLLVYLKPTECDAHCLKCMYLLRQIHTALGRDQERIHRVFLNQDPSQLAQVSTLLAAAYPEVTWVSTTPIELKHFYRGLHQATPMHEGVFVVDPHGNVMMVYPANFVPKGILTDLKRLLRASQIG